MPITSIASLHAFRLSMPSPEVETWDLNFSTGGVTVIFNDDMDPLTINGETFTMCTGARNIPGEITSRDSNTILQKRAEEKAWPASPRQAVTNEEAGKKPSCYFRILC
jgi:hypothetical protein